MLTLLEFNTAMEKGSVKYYFVFTAVAGLTLFLAYQHILECYALGDDYYNLYHNNHLLGASVATGRSVYGIFMSWLFSNLYYICDLKYARSISLIGILLFSVLLFRAYISSGWRRLEGGSAAIITCLMPAFGVYAAWATMSLAVYGALVAFVSGELCLKSYKYLSFKDHRVKGSMILIVSIILLMISLMTYQPSATAFWLFIAIALFIPWENSEDLFRKGLYCLIVFASVCMVYFVLYKETIWPFTIEPWGSRSEMVSNPVEKLFWFLEYPFYDALSLFNVLQEKIVISITAAIVYAVIVLGLDRRIMRCKQQKWQFIVAFVALIPLSYLPNLAVSENWPSFRTQGILGSLVVFYFLLSLKEIFQSRMTKIIMPCLLAVFILMAYMNVTYGFMEPQKQELELIRHALKGPLSKKAREIIFIRPHWSDSLVTKVHRARYEYGIPSTNRAWVPEGMTNLIAREIYDNAFEPIKVNIYKHNESINKDIPVINAHRLLQGFKIKRKLEKTFNASNDTLLLINYDKGYDGLKALHQVLFLPRQDGLVLKSQGIDPHFSLPLFNFSSGNQLIFKIDITSPKDTVLQLYYATKSSPNYNEKQSIKKRLRKGDNVIYFQLPLEEYTGRLRLDPGRINGEYLLRSIELRGN